MGKWRDAHSNWGVNHAREFNINTSQIMETEYIDQKPPQSFAAAIGGIDLEETIETACSKCQTPLGQVIKVFAGACLCDDCMEKYETKSRLEQVKKFWNRWCPSQFKETDMKHDDFARIWPMVRAVKESKENLIFCGQSGTCKTRAALCRMKLLLAYDYLEPHALWADALDEHLETKGYNANWKEQYKNAPVLLIDDLFTAGASLERYTKYIKGLLDYRLRENKVTIITTNLQARDISSDSGKFGNETKADQQRISAIIRRLRGDFKTLDFDAIGDGKF